MPQIRNIVTTRTADDLLETDYFTGQAAAGGSGSTFKASKGSIRRSIHRNTYWLSEFARAGGDFAANTAAMLEWKSKLRHKAITLVIDEPPENTLAWSLNQDLMWGLNGDVQGGTVLVEWPVEHTTRQTLMDYCTIKAAAEMIGYPTDPAGVHKRGPAFVARGDTHASNPWVAPGPTTELWNRAAWRFGDTHGKVLTAARMEHLLLYKTYNGTNRGPMETCSIGVYGDGLQENAGLEKCIFQGFRQPVCFPWYSPGNPPQGRNANFHLRDNNFNGAGPAVTTVSAGAAAGASVIPMAGTDTINGNAGLLRTLGLNVGDFLGVQTDTVWHWAAVVAVSPGVSATIDPPLPDAITTPGQDLGDGRIVGELHHASVNADIYGGSGCEVARNTAVHYVNTTTRPVAPNYRIAGELHLRDFHTEHGSASVQIGGMVLQDTDGEFFNNSVSGIATGLRVTECISNTNNFNGITGVTSCAIHRPARTAATDAYPLGSRPSYPTHGTVIDGLHDGAGALTHWLDIGDDTVIGAAPFHQRGIVLPKREYDPETFVGRIEITGYRYDSSNGFVYPGTLRVPRTDVRAITLSAGTYNSVNRHRAGAMLVTTGSGTVDINGFDDCQIGDELILTHYAGSGTLRLRLNADTTAGNRIWLASDPLVIPLYSTVRLVGTWIPSNQRGWRVFQGA